MQERYLSKINNTTYKKHSKEMDSFAIKDSRRRGRGRGGTAHSLICLLSFSFSSLSLSSLFIRIRIVFSGFDIAGPSFDQSYDKSDKGSRDETPTHVIVYHCKEVGTEGDTGDERA